VSAPEEIVCETQEAYEAVLAEHGVSPAVMSCPDFQASYTTYRPVRIVYRPPAPKPPPPIGCMRDEHIDALKRDGRFVLNGETILYEATPRDEAREAFEKWLSYDKEQHGVWDTAGMYRAFLAGLASVKP